ncbi:MAG: glutathione S-transferase [Brevundimonas subvibrioides]|uniref:Glutathione S-transferase n=1 Tax=Brevundimonas subvibrioides TaxID=74313 RepID=A0A258HJ56_9CAUL|nr:glutathione S-transferase family protein [Brevundimonas subvibrioides]OYX57055.1 MAG: glutathione S-transferase [Brevundimonas subvibrioides]
MSLVLYSHPFSSYCQKAIVAFYEKDLPFEQRRLESEGAMAELRALWPFGQFPVLKDGDRRFAEASIIIERLDQIAPATPLIPADPALGLETRFMDRVFDNHIQSNQQRIIYNALRPEADRDPIAEAEARAKLETAYAWLDAVMADRTWAAGAVFTLADCGAAPGLLYAHWTHAIPTDHVHLWAYRRRLLARPSYARALDEARPYRDYFPLGAPDQD